MSQSTESLRHDVARACRILVQLGLDSGPFGNVSVRIPGTQESWQNPGGVTFDRVRIEDIIRVDGEGRVLEGRHPTHPGEFIHREIYRLRPDAAAIVHTHSADTVAISLLGCPIEPFTQLGASLHGDQGVYLGFNGPVRDSGEGRSIAESLGPHAIVIAKNHGLFAVGATLKAAFWDMIVADMAAKVHRDAISLGLRKADVLPDATLRKSRREVRELQCDSMWENYTANLWEEHPELFR
jgi:ribulose-5-phosphate 4-epimerase/fuculose-1-phosphate aldolase